MYSKILVAGLATLISTQALAWGDREQGALLGAVIGYVIGKNNQPEPVYAPAPPVYHPAPVYQPAPYQMCHFRQDYYIQRIEGCDANFRNSPNYTIRHRDACYVQAKQHARVCQ